MSKTGSMHTRYSMIAIEELKTIIDTNQLVINNDFFSCKNDSLVDKISSVCQKNSISS